MILILDTNTIHFPDDDDNIIEEVSLHKHRVLVLCGNSGCGKSTALELICKDMGIGIKVWTDDCWDSDFNNYNGGGGSIMDSSGDVFSSLSSRRSHDLLFDTKLKSKV